MNDLVGIWISDPRGVPPEKFEKVQMEFTETGELIYIIVEDNSESIIFFTYSIEGYTLITDQPSAPRIERTKFVITPEGEFIRLILTHEGVSTNFVRLDPDL